MKYVEKLQEFYHIPENNHLLSSGNNAVGHFNVFPRWHCKAVKAYLRRDFYRVVLVVGTGILRYADKTVEIDRPALFLANEMIPYSWESMSEKQDGWVCVFTENFLENVGQYHVNQIFPILNKEEIPVYFLSEQELQELSSLFDKMVAEMNSDYIHKYSLLQSYLQTLLHVIQKLDTNNSFSEQTVDAAHRTAYRFLELLEQQLPIQSPETPLSLKSPKDYAQMLSIHINHLNYSVKKVTGKTSTALIADRIVQEAKSLLQNTDWSIAEIAEALGFEYPSHFTGFFRKHTHQSPKMLR